MTYNVLIGTLNPTHSLTQLLIVARARALAEITRANVCVHSRCQWHARAFARLSEQEVGYLLIISIICLYARSNVNENALRVLTTNVRRECEIGLILYRCRHWTLKCVRLHHGYLVWGWPRAGSWVVRIDPLHSWPDVVKGD